MDGGIACTALRVRVAAARGGWLCNRIAGASPGKKRKLSSSLGAQKSELTFAIRGV